MRNGLAKVVRFSALVVAGGALSFAVFFSNCGGSGGMRTGAAGTTGAGGSAGTTGSGGSGTAGVTGSGGRFTCPSDSTLNCSAALTLTNGHVTTFSAEEWSPTDGKYCNASGLRGSVFSYSGGPAPADGGAPSSNAHGVDAPAGNFRLTLTAAPGGYAGGGISFDRCVNAAASGATAIRFNAWVASGDISMCTFKSQLQTFEQRPTSQSPPGACDPDAGSCYNFPSAAVTLTTTSTPITIPFASFTSSATQASPAPGQVVGLQWQLESGGAIVDGGEQTACTAEIRIDDIEFVTP